MQENQKIIKIFKITYALYELGVTGWSLNAEENIYCFRFYFLTTYFTKWKLLYFFLIKMFLMHKLANYVFVNTKLYRILINNY